MKRYSLFFCLCFLASCTNQSSSTLEKNGTQDLHAVQSKRLHRLMDQIHDLMYERMMTAAEIDSQRRMRTEEMAKVADNLIKTVQDIPKALPSLSLSDDEQIVFLYLVRQLEEQVVLLKQEATRNEIKVIPERLDKIVAICNQCHSLFRKPPTE